MNQGQQAEGVGGQGAGGQGAGGQHSQQPVYVAGLQDQIAEIQVQLN